MKKLRAKAAKSDILAVLVHGTFATNADWTRDGSALRTALKEQFNQRISFEVFNWSGRNTFSARFSASKELAERLRHLAALHPNKRIIIVAHSHGGNIAAVAASHPALKEFRYELICLSTPFLSVKQRWSYPELSRIGGHAHLAVITVGSLLMLPWVGLAIHFWMSSIEPDSYWFRKHLLAVILASVCAFVGFIIIILRRLFTIVLSVQIQNKINSVSKRLGISQNLARRTLLLRMSADEASLAMSLSAFTNWIPAHLYNLQNNLTQKCVDRLLFVFKPIAIWVNCLKSRQKILGLVVSIVFLIAFVYGFILLLTATIVPTLVGATLIILLTLPLGVLRFYTFGPELSLLFFFVEIAAESSPPGKWSVQICEPAQPVGELIGLKHSLPYQDSRIIDIIVRWIENREKYHHT